MNQLTPTAGSRQMSSSLKERLKRCGRYHSSPKPTVSVSQPHQLQLSSASPLAAIAPSKESDHGTPVRKRASSSPNICRVPKRRQILKPSSDINDCATDNSRNSDLSHARSHADPCSEEVSKCTKMTELNSESLVQDKDDTCSSKQPNLGIDRVDEVGSDLNLLCNQEANKTECRTSDSVSDSTLTNSEASREIVPKPANSCDNKDRQTLLKELQEKKETLRQLHMVQMYRSKNDLGQLQKLIDKWRSAVQQALPDLHAEMTGEPKPSLTQLIDHLGIDHSFIQYDPEEETFGLGHL